MNVYPIKIFNNLTRSRVDFKTKEIGRVKFYSCGPTTYDFIHVGNGRALVVGDLIHRILRCLGYKVTFVRNFTDVDDKIIDRARELNVDPLLHSARFVDEVKTDMKSLNMIPASYTPKVSETMPEIIEMIETLIKKDFAYNVNGEVLYHVPHFATYGKLSKKDLKSLEHGIRVEVDSHKRHSSDFVLWKPAKGNELSWDSPWGKGRPGWHIECSAMAKKYLGNTIDLHHGGVDLMFPHHENEIAQSEAANGCEFSSCWVHNEFLNFGTEKMSKSLGNVVTIRKFVESFGGEVLRQVLMSVHYRSKMEWSNEVIERGLSDLERLHHFLINYLSAKKNHQGEPTVHLASELSEVVPRMKADLANDFNVPGALSHLFTAIRLINKEYLDENGKYLDKSFLGKEEIVLIENIIAFSKEALGCFHFFSEPDIRQFLTRLSSFRNHLKGGEGQHDQVEKLIKERKEARITKNWSRADEIRNALDALNVEVKDAPDGTTTWRFK